MKDAESLDLVKKIGMDRVPGGHAVRPVYRRISFGAAYPATGIIKFLGYYDSTFNIANMPSVSMVTDFSEAYAAFVLTEESGNDSVVFNGIEDERLMARSMRAIHLFRSIYSINGSFHLYVEIRKKYQRATGLGESAAISAAAARSVARSVFDGSANEDAPFLSRIARLASGYGAASVTGPISVWISGPGLVHDTSFAAGLSVPDTGMAICAVPIEMDLGSLDIHAAAMRSPFYNIFASYQRRAVSDFLSAQIDADALIRVATNNTLLTHSVLMSSYMLLWTEETIEIVRRILEMRSKGYPVGISIDGGPSVVVMARNAAELEKIEKYISGRCVHGKIASGEPELPRDFARIAEENLGHYL
ncbi:hypothetical protein [Thermoplasma sp.]|uniref:hypothetical protein n=1 Tax=Thermoplasma sp. TaxID=1973142 RepID=UPI001274AA04|nr:hypothetical protein [Thermoplasma sp.]KAA8922230.1 MAG: hypothetical protein F6Q11_05360 [Thermoplasma sp.]